MSETSLDRADLERLSPADREEVLRFAAFLQAVGPRSEADPQVLRERLWAWIAADPVVRRDYLGVPPETGELEKSE